MKALKYFIIIIALVLPYSFSIAHETCPNIIGENAEDITKNTFNFGWKLDLGWNISIPFLTSPEPEDDKISELESVKTTEGNKLVSGIICTYKTESGRIIAIVSIDFNYIRLGGSWWPNDIGGHACYDSIEVCKFEQDNAEN